MERLEGDDQVKDHRDRRDWEDGQRLRRRTSAFEGSHPVNRIQALAVAFSILLAAPSVASAADLTVAIKDVRDAKGNVLVVVYDESKSPRKGAQSSWKTASYRASISPEFQRFPA